MPSEEHDEHPYSYTLLSSYTISTLSSMMQELVEALTERGHNVIVATAWLKDPWNARRILKEHNS